MSADDNRKDPTSSSEFSYTSTPSGFSMRSVSFPSSSADLRGPITRDQFLDGGQSSSRPIRVLLYGKAGDGKSTVGNMLLGGLVEGYLETRRSVTAVTSNVIRRCSENNHWEVIDTVGLFSPNNRVSDAHLSDKLHDFLVRECPEIDVICYVKRASKYTGADEICLNHFKRLFKGQKIEQNVVLVFTSCPDQNTFFTFNDKLISKHMGGEYRKRVGVEFPPKNSNIDLEEMMREKRRSSLRDLENELQRVVTECDGPVVLKSEKHFSCYNTLTLSEERHR